MKKNTITLLAEILFAAVIFGGGSWIFELIDDSGTPAWKFALQGLVFGLIYVPISHWLRKKDRELEK